jgi:glycine/D-amino acid oxidase-like deaminating enzyme
MEDYLVVGLGLAGMAFCEILERNGKSFRVIDDDSQKASRVAGGIYNPVVLKRINKAWKADNQLPLVAPFYSSLEQKLSLSVHYNATILRRFASVEEQNLWFEAADSPSLQGYLAPHIRQNTNPALNAAFGFGEVPGTGRVDTNSLLIAYSGYLQSKGLLIRSHFEFDSLECKTDHFSYDGLKAGKIVFATGFGLLENPYFSYLPLQGNKGEYLEIISPQLREKHIIKAAIFLIPLGGDHYLAGATYNWKDKTPTPTPVARKYLLQKLDELLLCPYKVVRQMAGIRPTVPDRRPLLGQHPTYKNMYMINGFGSRGVMIAPYAAMRLFNTAEYGEPPDPEMDIRRYAAGFVSGRQHGGRNG